MLFSVVHITARTKPYPSFPQGWRTAMRQWFGYCVRPEQVEYIVVVHESRINDPFVPILQDGASIWGSFRVVVNDRRDCCVDQSNAGSEAATGKLMIGAMDDLYAPRNWDEKIARAIPDHDKPYVLHCSTSSQWDESVFTPGICTRARYEQTGPISPEYESIWLDLEFATKARADGVVVEAPHINFDHRHPSFGTGIDDEVYKQHHRPEACAVGQATFYRRRALGFPKVVLDKPEEGVKLCSTVSNAGR